jgi:hypothetical protein
MLSQSISPAPMREQHLLLIDEQEMEHARLKPAVRFELVITIKTESQVGVFSEM